MPYMAPTPTNIQSYLIDNVGLQPSVSSNALTITMTDRAYNVLSSSNQATIGFRSSTITNGTYNLRTVNNGITITVSSGSTLGHTSGVAQYMYVYAIDNSGTVELAVSSTLFDDGIYMSTTAEGGAGAADDARTLYSTTARSNVPIRLIGRMRSTQTTAGTWAAVPSQAALVPFTQSANTWSTTTSRMEWARITFSSGTPVVFASSSSWITSITDNGTGDITLNFKAFGANPFIFLTPENTANDKLSLTVASFSTTTANIRISRSDTATLVDTNFFVMSIGDS